MQAAQESQRARDPGAADAVLDGCRRLGLQQLYQIQTSRAQLARRAGKGKGDAVLDGRGRRPPPSQFVRTNQTVSSSQGDP